MSHLNTISPIKQRATISPNTQSKSPHYTDTNLGMTYQKSQPTMKQSLYTSKFDKSVESEQKGSIHLTNTEFEIRKLMNLIELQQHEINNWKRRYEQSEARNNSNNASRTMQEYEKHMDQLTVELKGSLAMNDEFAIRLREKEEALVKLQRSSDTRIREYQDEVEYLKQQNLQADQETYLQIYSKDQQLNTQLQSIQQAHMNQIKMMDDQVQKLTDELIRRNQAQEYYKSEMLRQEKQIAEVKHYEKSLIDQVDGMKKKHLELIERSDQQINVIKQESNQERQAMLDQMDELDKQCMEYKHLIEELQRELQQQVEQTCRLQEEIQDGESRSNLDYRQLEQKYCEQAEDMKEQFSRQLKQLVDEVEQLQDTLNIQQQQMEEYNETNNQLKETINQLSRNLEMTTSEFMLLQSQHEELQQNYQLDVAELNEEIERMEDQSQQMDELLEQKNCELDQSRQQKNQIAIKNNDANLQLQKLQVEVEGARQKSVELQKQFEHSEQVYEEIKKQQIEQMRRQLDSQLDMMESENRTLRHQYELKCKECEEWKQQCQ